MTNEVARYDQADVLIGLFARCFRASEQTILVGGGAEPYYLPRSAQRPYHQVIFTRNYARSALHEVAHWCVAGRVRRQLVDYGYWYAPDGRTPEQQAAFMQVEVLPQAIEWLFCLSCDLDFEVSLDNLGGTEVPDLAGFTRQVVQRGQQRWQQGLPPRARQFCQALQAHWQLPPLTSARLRQAGQALMQQAQERQAYATL